MKNDLINYLNELFPNAKCELNYNKDYELLLATMMSAQTTDKRVNSVNKILFEKYKTLSSLASADIEDIKKIIKPIGTYNKKAANIISIAKSLEVLNYVPNDRTYLESLSGVGRKTANVVLSNLYNEPCIAVDTHVSRVSKRLLIASEEDNPLVIEKKLNKLFDSSELLKIHHQLVLFGRYYCTARSPLCENCKIKKHCNYKKNA